MDHWTFRVYLVFLNSRFIPCSSVYTPTRLYIPPFQSPNDVWASTASGNMVNSCILIFYILRFSLPLYIVSYRLLSSPPFPPLINQIATVKFKSLLLNSNQSTFKHLNCLPNCLPNCLHLNTRCPRRCPVIVHRPLQLFRLPHPLGMEQRTSLHPKQVHQGILR